MRKRLTKTIVCERFICQDVVVCVLVIGVRDSVIGIAGMNGLVPAFIDNGCQITMVLIPVLDVATVRSGMRDPQNLANGGGATLIARGVIIGVGDRIDVPICVVAQSSGVSLKISVIEHNLRLGAGNSKMNERAAIRFRSPR